MTEDIRKAVIRAISDRFALPVYGCLVPQGGRTPCITVELAEMEQKRLLGNRSARKVVFEIRYYCGQEKRAAEAMQAVDGLYEALGIIGTEEKFAAGKMQHEKTADGVKIRVTYEYHVIFTEDEAALMERLEYNGKEAVGYEERDIQQRAAEQE